MSKEWNLKETGRPSLRRRQDPSYSDTHNTGAFESSSGSSDESVALSASSLSSFSSSAESSESVAQMLAPSLSSVNFPHRPIHNISKRNVIWSKNWHNLVTDCPSVPMSYYTAATDGAKRIPLQEFVSYFTGCGGVLWLRTGEGDSYNDVSTFIRHVAPTLSKRFSIISSDGVRSVPSQVLGAAELLNNPLLDAWYTQNYDGSIQHPKLVPVPIGFDFHTNWKGLWSSSVEVNLNQMKELRENNYVRSSILLIPPWSVGSHMERRRAANMVSCIPHKRKEHMGIDRLWEMYEHYKFALSPFGRGLDCHRTWELLFFGVVPIVKTSGMDPLYKGLPVVIVNDWDDLCVPGFLDAQWEKFEPMLPVPSEVFTLEHWVGQN